MTTSAASPFWSPWGFLPIREVTMPEPLAVVEMERASLIRLRHCCLQPTDWGCLTIFEDGAQVPSTPDWEGAHYAVISHRCGYGDDRLRYCVEHDFAHAFVVEKLFDRPSDVLWALAHGTMLTGKQAAYEEFMAQGFQRWLRANERPILGGCDWDSWKAEALELLGG